MTYAAEILADSPAVYYKFDEATSSSVPGSVIDSSGNARHGDFQNNPSVNLASLLVDGSGTSMALNGTNQFVYLANAGWMYSTSETITIRFRPTSGNLSGDTHITSRWQSGGSTKQFLLYLHNGKLQGSIFDTAQRDAVGATTLVAGTDYTCAMRYNASTGVLSVILNGVVDGSTSGLGTIAPGTGSAIEVGRAAAAVYGAVRVDEFAYFTAPLSDARLLAQHNAAIAAAPPPSGGDLRIARAAMDVMYQPTPDLRLARAGLDVLISNVLPDPPPPAGPGTLWSTQTFAILPGDLLEFTATASQLGGDPATMTPVIAYAAEGLDVIPGGADTSTVVMDADEVLVDGDDVEMSSVLIVPDETDDGIIPAQARVGLQFTPDGPVDLVVSVASLTTASGDWPLGAVWFNPSAPQGGLDTINTSGSTGSSTTLPSRTTWGRAPGTRKAIVIAPADTGGVVVVHAWGTVQLHESGNPVDVKLNATGDAGTWSQVRLRNDAAYMLTGSVQIDAGERMAIWPEYQYVSSTSSPSEVLYAGIQTQFVPGAKRGGSSDPMISYWDGDSWEPADLECAEVDQSQDATDTDPATTGTTTTITRSPSSLLPGQTITLVATVTPAGANGKVTFYRGPTSSGPWTSLGSTTLNVSNKARKTWQPTRGDTYFFKATYAGNATYERSSDVSGATVVGKEQRRFTSTSHPVWVQAYQGDDDQVSGSSHDDAVSQGYFDGTHGNQKSLLRFNPGLPDDAEVTQVRLRCTNWAHWFYFSGGTLRVGWHSNTTQPATWTLGGAGHVSLSTHNLDLGGFDVVLPWGDALENPDFRGLTIGPGDGSSHTYYGYSADGTNPWTLVVEYLTRTY